MESNKKYLLSTRPLPKSIIEEGAAKNIIIEERSFITTIPVEDEELFQSIKRLSTERHTVIFTSMNAVDAVVAHVASTPHWQIYAIGNTTRKLIEEAWGTERIAATAENAQRLGERLVDDGVKEVVFFCGNIRRDELPNKVRSEGGKVEEIVVYQTQETQGKVLREYDGILFFSPSAVQAFYTQNNPPKTTVLFAIGKTTAEALREHKGKKIQVGKVADKVALARQAIDYLAGDIEQR